jgi:NitT/TauT family transport system substrate-binding protein
MPFNLPRWLRPAAAAIAAAATAVAAGCGPATATAGSGLEKTHLTVAVLRATDEVPFEIALKDGYFAREGLSVTVIPVTTTTSAIPGLLKGSIDLIAGANYVSFFLAQAKGVLSIKVIAPAGSCTASDFAIMALPHSPVTRPSDLAGKTVAVSLLASVTTLTLDAQLRANGVNPASVHLVAIPFADGLAALERHEVDAAGLIEPFLTQAEVAGGAVPVLPLCTGPTAGLPLSGDIATAAWAARNPRTAAAFAKAIAEAAADAAASHPNEEKALASLVSLSIPDYALVNYNAYPEYLNPVAIQQVADLMSQDGMLARPLDVTSLLFQPEKGSSR